MANVLLLRREQALDKHRALAIGREFRRPVVDMLARVRGQCDQRIDVLHFGVVARGFHRSISPNTTSYVPIMATTSASMCPRTIASIDDKCAKPGARRCTRNGLFAPSETR